MIKPPFIVLMYFESMTATAHWLAVTFCHFDKVILISTRFLQITTITTTSKTRKKPCCAPACPCSIVPFSALQILRFRAANNAEIRDR